MGVNLGFFLYFAITRREFSMALDPVIGHITSIRGLLTFYHPVNDFS